MAASTKTQPLGDNISDILAMSITEKPASGDKSTDELLKQIKELNKALALSEEAVRISESVFDVVFVIVVCIRVFFTFLAERCNCMSSSAIPIRCCLSSVCL